MRLGSLDKWAEPSSGNDAGAAGSIDRAIVSAGFEDGVVIGSGDACCAAGPIAPARQEGWAVDSPATVGVVF